MRILIVEDDEILAQTLSQHLVSQRYAVDLATDGESGWDHIQMLTYDLILLDIDLPRLDGIALCKRLRFHRHEEPVLLLTARAQVANRVQGLDAGADDYLVKPYSMDELSARVRALLRRQGSGSGLPLLTWGPLCLDPKLCELTVEEQAIALSPKEYQLMELLLRHPQQVLSSRRILDHIWGFDDVPGKDTVRTHVRRLRKKLKPVGAEHWIETVYGLGYRLKAKDAKPQDYSHSSNSKKEPPSTDYKLAAQEDLSSSTHIAQTINDTEHQATEPFKTPVPLAPDPLSSIEAARQASLALWPKFRPKALEHLTVLEEAIASLEQAVINHPHQRYQLGLAPFEDRTTASLQRSPFPIDEQLHRQGERAAHKLVGSLGMFGMPEGSELAGQMETLLQQFCPALISDFGMAVSLVRRLRLKCESLHHLLGVGNTQRAFGMNLSTGLLSYPQARRDIDKYFCLARRHHHAIALAWIRFVPSPLFNHEIPEQPAIVSSPHVHQQWLESTQTYLNPLLLSWARSVRQSLREEDIVTQCADNMVLLVLYACTKEDALRRLKPFLKQLSELARRQEIKAIEISTEWPSQNKPDAMRVEQKEHEGAVDIGSCPNVINPSIFLSSKLAEFPQDGQTFEVLEAAAFHSREHFESIPILETSP